jgi:hypothetical protein
MIECIKCKQSKANSEYFPRAEGGFYNTCKKCKRAYGKARYQEKRKDLQWRIYRSEVNKQLYKRKKNQN